MSEQESKQTIVEGAFITPNTRSIWLSVAFKAAVDLIVSKGGVAEGADTAAAVRAGTEKLYNEVLVALGKKYDAGDAENPRERKRGGGGGGGGRGGGSQPKYDRSKFNQYDVDYFGNGDKIRFYDQRPAKQAGAYSPKAPDFSSVEKYDLGDGKGERNIPLWLEFNGEPNQDEVSLLLRAGVPGLEKYDSSPDYGPDEAPF